MPVTKIIPCHTETSKWSVMYAISKKSIAADYINCCACDELGRNVWEQFDATREVYGRFRPRMRAVKDDDGNVEYNPDGTPRLYDSTIYYVHLIISPDPKDHATLDQVRAVATQWVEGEFPGFQIVVGYHDDNGIVHAHALVNGIDLAGEVRAHDVTRETRWAWKSFDRLQAVARRNGLSSFRSLDGEELETPENELRREAMREEAAATDALGAAPLHEGAPDIRSKEVAALHYDKRYSWVEDIRLRCDTAARMSRTVDEYVQACTRMGVVVAPAKRGWKYALAEGGGRQITGERLGARWTRAGVARRLAKDERLGQVKPAGELRQAMLETIGAIATADGVLGVELVAVYKAADTEEGRYRQLLEVVGMLDALEAYDVASLSELEDAVARTSDPEERRSLELAARVGFLPQERPADMPRRGLPAEPRAAATRKKGEKQHRKARGETRGSEPARTQAQNQHRTMGR